MRRAFDDLTDQPCPVCLELASAGAIQARAVMPLPVFPGRSRRDNRLCCRDCQATDATMSMGWQHPEFAAARLTIANERLEGLTMPPGMMEHCGLCKLGWVRPCSLDDLAAHVAWLKRHGIPDFCGFMRFEQRVQPGEDR